MRSSRAPQHRVKRREAHRKEEYPRKTADEIVRWAYDALDESTLETAPVPPEWGLDRVAARAAELRAELLGDAGVPVRA